MNPRIFLLALSTFAFGSGALIFSGLLEMLAADLRVSTGVAGQLQTSYVLASAFAGPPLAFLVGRLERKSVLLAALGLSAALNLVCMISAQFSHLLVLRAVIGATAALAGPAAASAAAALAPPERRGSAMAIVGGGMTVAFLMGIPMGSVVGSIFGWRAAFALAAALAAAAFAGIALFLPRVKAPPPALGAGVTFSKTAPLFAATFLSFGANMVITTYIATVLREPRRLVGIHFFNPVALMPLAYWSQPLGQLMGALMAVGSGAALWSLAGRVGRARSHAARIQSIELLGEERTQAPIEVVCALPSSWPGHRAGQFAFVRFDQAEGAHPFTIASAPDALGSSLQGEPLVRLVIKPLGDYTRTLHQRLRVGQPVDIEGPYGRFDGQGSAHRTQVWVGAGCQRIVGQRRAEVRGVGVCHHRACVWYTQRSPRHVV